MPHGAPIIAFVYNIGLDAFTLKFAEEWENVFVSKRNNWLSITFVRINCSLCSEKIRSDDSAVLLLFTITDIYTKNPLKQWTNFKTLFVADA